MAGCYFSFFVPSNQKKGRELVEGLEKIGSKLISVLDFELFSFIENNFFQNPAHFRVIHPYPVLLSQVKPALLGSKSILIPPGKHSHLLPIQILSLTCPLSNTKVFD
jgi:hypothetical protein